VLVFFLFPKKDDEERLLTEYQSEDASHHAARVSSPIGGALIGKNRSERGVI